MTSDSDERAGRLNSPATDSLRIVLAPSAYYPNVGGIEELTRQLALTLIARGHSVSVLANLWPDGVPSAEELDGVRVVRQRFPLPAARTSSLARFATAAPAAVAELLRRVRSDAPDIVHVIGAGPQSVYLAALAPLHQVPLVFTAQGELTFDAQDVFAESFSLRWGLKRMLRVADAVTACSAFVLEDVCSFAPIAASQEVVPNGVDPTEFAVVGPEAGLEPYVLGVGRLVPQKGFDTLIDAFARLSRTEYLLILAGDGVERDALKRRAREHGLTTRVRFPGAVGRPELARLLRGARAFALPSRGEPFGIALLEAMAAGTPAVATMAGGIPEFAREGENALLVPPDDVPGLGAAIERLVGDEELRTRLRAGGTATARDLTWTKIARWYEHIYANAIETRGR
jgi:glycosyltransferase involved in cell wall biosynthesis